MITVLIKILFFPLANKSYASMAKMKAVQPQMMALRERYPDDKMKQQQELTVRDANQNFSQVVAAASESLTSAAIWNIFLDSVTLPG